MNHSPIAAPANGPIYWLAAESEAGESTMMVYGIAPASSSTDMTRATVDCF
jgi:hypothetical protein